MINIDNIPQELKGLNMWAVHSNKVPYRGYLRYNKINKAKANDPETWTSLDSARQLLGNTYIEKEYNKGTKKYDIEQKVRIDGLSLMIAEPYVFFDLDHVINSKGETLPEAQEILDMLDSYTEVSTSGTGYHILIKASAPHSISKNCPNRPLPNSMGWEQTEEKPPMIETFTNKRFMVFTGSIYQGRNRLADCTDGLNTVFDNYIKPTLNISKKGNKKASTPKEFREYDGKDEKIKAKAEEVITQLSQLAKESTKAKFNKLYKDGDISDYNNDHSKADLGLCCMAARHSKDTRVIDYVMKSSALYRDKWDRPDYKKDTIEKSIRAVQYNSSGLKVNDKGKILHTKENTNTILNQMFIEMGYNVLTNEMEVTNKPYTKGIDYLVNEVYSYCRSIDFNIKKSDLEDNIYFLAKDYMFNPFMDYILKCEADNKNCFGELEKLFATLELDIDIAAVEEYSKTKELCKTMIKKWLISVVALNIQEDLNAKDGPSVEGTLVLFGGQGIGKTTWLRNLVPPGYFKEGATLENNKDTKMEVYRYPLVELGELEHTTGRQETGFLKQELTRTSIEYRPPYAKSNIKFARHTIFCGSVNDEKFLKDMTGNRRFWVIPVKSIDIKAKIDINKLWAEVTALYRLGVPWYLSKEERTLLDVLNTQYISISDVGMAIQNTFDFSKPKEEWVYISINSVYELVHHQFNGRVSEKTIGEQLRLLGCKDTQRRVVPGQNPKRIWQIPPLKFGYWNEKPLEMWELIGGKFIPLDLKLTK